MSIYINSAFDADGRPFDTTTGTDFIRRGYDEIASGLYANIFQGLATTKNYVIQGCVKSVSGGTTIITQGYVYNPNLGRVIFSPAQSFANPTGGDVICADLLLTYADSGGTSFDSGATHQILVVEQVKYRTLPSGSGNLNGGASARNDFDNFIFTYPIFENRTDINADTITFERSRTIIYATSDATLNVIDIDVTDAMVGSEIILRAPATSGAVLAFSGDTSNLLGLNSIVSPTATSSTFWNLRLVFKGNTDYITVEIWNV